MSNQFIYARSEHPIDSDNDWADVCTTIESILGSVGNQPLPIIVETHFGSGPSADIARRLFVAVNGRVVEFNGLPSDGNLTFRPAGKLVGDDLDQAQAIAIRWFGSEDLLAGLPGTHIISVETEPDETRQGRMLVSNVDSSRYTHHVVTDT